MAANPTRGLTPVTTAADPPVEVMSAKAWPAKDWPLITVNTPTGAHTQATTTPTTAAVCTAEFEKNPGWKIGVPDAHGRRRDGALAAGRWPSSLPGAVARAARLLGSGLAAVFAVLLAHRDDDPAMGVEDVDVVAVEPGEHVAAHHFLGRPGGRPAPGQVNDAVHDGEERVHVVGREQDGHPLLPGYAAQEA